MTEQISGSESTKTSDAINSYTDVNIHFCLSKEHHKVPTKDSRECKTEPESLNDFVMSTAKLLSKSKNIDEAFNAFNQSIGEKDFVEKKEVLPALKKSAKLLNSKENNVLKRKKAPSANSSSASPVPRNCTRANPKVALVSHQKTQTLRIFDDFLAKHKTDLRSTKYITDTFIHLYCLSLFLFNLQRKDDIKKRHELICETNEQTDPLIKISQLSAEAQNDVQKNIALFVGTSGHDG